MLIRRSKKRWRHRRRAASSAKSESFRVYDRDIPEVPLTVDWYEGRLHCSLFVHPSIDEEEEEEVLLYWAEGLRVALGARSVACKLRRRMRGAQQYEVQRRQGERFAVSEGGYRFLIDLESYLDTGLFLDHRKTRRLAGDEAVGRRALNLFAYTGSFAVYLAGGGARSTMTVDSSRAYLDWAEENLRLNELDGPAHRFYRGDVRSFLEEAAHRQSLYDLIVLDPPTFSNRKGGEPFSVTSDHGELIRAIEPIAAPSAVLYFSTNARRFQFDERLLDRWEGREISQQTIPRDFEQRPSHRCWRLIYRGG